MVSNDRIAKTDTYSLRQLFGGELTIVIPDMQRDYCWGLDDGPAGFSESKVGLFVSGLVYLYQNDMPTTLGLLYGYEDPPGSKHLMIIDGQQRLTTLYLLVGMLYRRTPTHELRQMLIRDFELTDDRQPRLLYQIRNEAMYFMSDLVIHFFLDRNGRLSKLKDSDWYFKAYDSDPTVQSYIGAIRHIDVALEQAAALPDWDFASFAEFVCDKLVFIYHDLQCRKSAEAMFITINTTGEPLTLAQNYKSMLLSHEPDQDVADRWEEMESWAWLNRDASDCDHPLTSDLVLDRFMRLWIVRCGNDQREALNPQRFDEMYSFYRAFRTLATVIPDAIKGDPSSADYAFLVLPTIAYIRRWHFDFDSAFEKKHIADFWGLLHNITRYQKVSASGSDTKEALRIVGRMSTPDIVSLTDVDAGPSSRILNPEEKAQLKLLSSTQDRELAQRLIDRGRQHPMLNGRIQKVISWATAQGADTDLARLEHYIDMIYEVWGVDLDCQPSLDLVRRALLTMRHPQYPIVRRGNMSLSLCWREYDWQRLMSTAPGLIRALIDRVSSMDMPVSDALTTIVARFKDRQYPYNFIVRDPKLVTDCVHRMLLCPSKPFLGYYRMPSSGRSDDMRWYLEQMPIRYDTSCWSMMRTYGTRCIFTDHKVCNLSLAIYHTPEDKLSYRVEMYSRPDREETAQQLDIQTFANEIGLPMRFDRHRGRYYTAQRDAHAALAMFNTITRAL